MATKPESLRQRKIRAALREEFPRLWDVKYHGGPFSQSGVPDVLICVEGMFVALEVKMPDEEPDQLQKMTMADIRRAGGIAESVETVEEAISVVRKVRRLSKRRRALLSRG